VSGLLIADPCVDSGSVTSAVACTFAGPFKTATRTSALLNAFVPELDYWGVLGDNFYDREGLTTRHFYGQLTTATKSKIMVTVPGNHDYWVLGGPQVGRTVDQYGYGWLQWYGQDVKASESWHAGAAQS